MVKKPLPKGGGFFAIGATDPQGLSVIVGAMNGPKHTDEELRQLAKAWFSEARQKSAQENAEVTAWHNERRKWSPLTGYYSSGSYNNSNSSNSSDSGGGDSGGGSD